MTTAHTSFRQRQLPHGLPAPGSSNRYQGMLHRPAGGGEASSSRAMGEVTSSATGEAGELPHPRKRPLSCATTADVSSGVLQKRRLTKKPRGNHGNMKLFHFLHVRCFPSPLVAGTPPLGCRRGLCRHLRPAARPRAPAVLVARRGLAAPPLYLCRGRRRGVVTAGVIVAGAAACCGGPRRRHRRRRGRCRPPSGPTTCFF